MSAIFKLWLEVKGYQDFVNRNNVQVFETFHADLYRLKKSLPENIFFKITILKSTRIP